MALALWRPGYGTTGRMISLKETEHGNEESGEEAQVEEAEPSEEGEGSEAFILLLWRIEPCKLVRPDPDSTARRTAIAAAPEVCRLSAAGQTSGFASQGVVSGPRKSNKEEDSGNEENSEEAQGQETGQSKENEGTEAFVGRGKRLHGKLITSLQSERRPRPGFLRILVAWRLASLGICTSIRRRRALPRCQANSDPLKGKLQMGRKNIMAAKKVAKKAKRLHGGKALRKQKTLTLTPAAPSPVPMPYPNMS